MSQIFKTYFLDFWVWWYWFMARHVLLEVKTEWLFALGKLNIVAMVTNLFRPLFQDNSFEGKLVAFPIRLTWVLVGTLILSVYTIILGVGILLYFLVPLLPILVLLNSTLHWL